MDGDLTWIVSLTSKRGEAGLITASHVSFSDEGWLHYVEDGTPHHKVWVPLHRVIEVRQAQRR